MSLTHCHRKWFKTSCSQVITKLVWHHPTCDVQESGFYFNRFHLTFPTTASFRVCASRLTLSHFLQLRPIFTNKFSIDVAKLLFKLDMAGCSRHATCHAQYRNSKYNDDNNVDKITLLKGKTTRRSNMRNKSTVSLKLKMNRKNELIPQLEPKNEINVQMIFK